MALAGPGTPGGDSWELAAVRVDSEPDVFAARQLARVVGAAAGLDGQDQVRLATAVSEVGRETLPAGGALAVFRLNRPAGLAVLITADRPLAGDAPGLRAAARLVDVTVAPGGASRVVALARPLAPGTVVDEALRAHLRRAVAASAPLAPVDELRVQNNELVSALEELKNQQNELLRLNAELEETNKGVLALYNQLSSELEQTNRGVVALYAELDERGMALEKVNETKTRFLRSVSHELRSPVNSVLGLARLLLDPVADPLTAEQRRQVELILASSDDLLLLVNDLLDLAKAESGRLTPNLDEVDIHGVLAHVEGTQRPLAIRPGVRLVFEEPAGIGTLRTDESLLGRVLRNLVGNALKFTERGEVRVAVRSTGRDGTTGRAETTGGPGDAGAGPGDDTVSFVVRDTGIGIAPDDVERVFDEFYQAQSHLHAQVRGTGLGLPYARRVCQLLGGRLELESVLGTGSTFTVTLPRDSSTAVGATAIEPAAGEALADLDPPWVETALVVDDDPAFRTMMRSLLADRAGRVVEAADGSEALAVLRAELPDVVFLDLMLPQLDGRAVLSAMADDPVLRDIPVVVVTWSDHEAVGGRGGFGSAVAVLAKSTLSARTIDGALTRARADWQ
ncbi:ATP-binding response regulator [Parafrankia discariae]|uniref:ATP-binding response regulator n=1 Tax=Parafrankia discariae TaxID=365528 RepID=UPI0006865658|nr:ATP-binding protein [Parafrankia discariae]